MEIHVGRAAGAAVAQGYLDGEEAACRFYEGHFTRLADYRTKAAEVDARFGREGRARAAEAMVVPPGGDPERIERFVADGGFVVTTGQQPGLFGGPLYSLLKAVSTLNLARSLEAALGVPVLPLYWVGSEDHDWLESNHADVIGVDNELHRVEVPSPDPDRHPPIHRLKLGAELQEAVEQFLKLLPETEFSDYCFRLLRGAYVPGATLADGFHAVLGELLGARGLILTDAAHPAVKAASAPLLLEELERSAEMEALLQRTAAELEGAGFALQVPLIEGALNLFLEGPAGRERLYREDGAYRLRTSGETLELDDIRARVAEDPLVLSPGVLLRPVVESAVFPTLSYVGGPGELAYFAQIRAYFQAHGIRMPVFYPRHSVTIVESKIRKVLDKFGLDVEDLHRPFHEIAAARARDEMPEGIRKALGELRGAIASGVARVQKEVATLDPTLKGTAQHVRSQAFAAVEELERKVLQAVKREHEIALSQMEKAQLHLFPNGAPAERVQSPFYFLTRYGGTFLDRLQEAFEVNLNGDGSV